MLRNLAAVLLIIAVSAGAASADSGMFARFPGKWSCKGHFISNGAPITANVSILFDERSGALIVRHDDVAPGAYHALEVWTANKDGTGARASISDRYSGMRWLETSGMAGNDLVWTRLENGVAAEQFAYEFKGEMLQIEWSVARGGAMKLGDTLLCRR